MGRADSTGGLCRICVTKACLCLQYIARPKQGGRVQRFNQRLGASTSALLTSDGRRFVSLRKGKNLLPLRRGRQRRVMKSMCSMHNRARIMKASVTQASTPASWACLPPALGTSSLLLLGLVLCLGIAGRASGALTFQYSGYFGAQSTPPNTPVPWVTATLSQYAYNEVQLNISLPCDLPKGTYLDSLYLNYDPSQNASLLTVTGPGITSDNNKHSRITAFVGNNANKSDGDGFYDIVLGFPNSGGMRLAAPNSTSYYITGPTGGNLTPNSFLFLSEGSKTGYYAAAHVAGYSVNGCASSAWLSGAPSAVPEANFGLTSGVLLLGLAALGIKHRVSGRGR